jgi:hypothetical protein
MIFLIEDLQAITGHVPTELKVDFIIKGNAMLHPFHSDKFKGGRKEGQFIQRAFRQHVKLPKGLVEKAIQCNMGDKGGPNLAHFW